MAGLIRIADRRKRIAADGTHEKQAHGGPKPVLVHDAHLALIAAAGILFKGVGHIKLLVDREDAQLLQHRDERTELGGRPFDVHADFVSMDDSHFLFRFGRAPPDTAAKTWPWQAQACVQTLVFFD